MINDDDNIDPENEEQMAEAQLKVCQAFIQFNSFFSEYIKEMDIQLWQKAVDYAKDSVNIPGVELRILDKDEEE